ncbi:hypothetical protein HYX00_02640 [Candidatus Woesearchaeota archaeon]|nr:hypothetical protein [Candidatus Woesearchaeota archaeon]
MEWKEFFKPDLKKISVTIIITIFEFIMFFISGFGAICKPNGNCFGNWYNVVAKILSIHTYFFVGLTESSFDSPIINIITIIVINIVVGYLTSCVLFYLLNKRKN